MNGTTITTEACAATGSTTTLAEKIDGLFRVVRRPNREQYSHEEVAKACREATGETFSATYLWQLRTGRRDNPTKRHLEALAQFFQVPVAYFFDDDQGAVIAQELELLGALRDAGVRSVALRAVNLSPEGVGTISDMIDVIARREGGSGKG
ncbi:helix-turn-helix domain-containing protein [Kitasatospora sp. NBC_01287]|uniref:helix-turn-helix domain-containing protein n=1 Tax=Kitasatospora sp. NBC_01287 TaxID=2903573 RepID=UPI0022585AC4|nr:helix-turn-helix domain-containing protein [Kitasatospora sp. NBC_01287]MCX4749962.1 helix-turn-helix domain-containing protein [Kitasatospora sp. NBC_01287]